MAPIGLYARLCHAFLVKRIKMLIASRIVDSMIETLIETRLLTYFVCQLSQCASSGASDTCGLSESPATIIHSTFTSQYIYYVYYFIASLFLFGEHE